MSINSPTIEQQRSFWNSWDQKYLKTLDHDSLRRADTAVSLLRSLGLKRPHILEVGCGNGWFSERLLEFGRVTGVDIADLAIAEAKQRIPNAAFFAGDFCSLNLPVSRFDVVVTLETFSHVPGQAEFVRQLASVLKPGGHLIMTTQNRVVHMRRSDIAPLGRGQLRRWVTTAELRALLSPHFDVLREFTIRPNGHLGFLRIVNSVKLDRALSLVVSRSTLESLKEKAGLGQTIVILARASLNKEQQRPPAELLDYAS